MPIISTFYGIVVAMFFGDHNPPHVHVRYGEFKAMVGIHPATVLQGQLPKRAHKMVLEWVEIHRDELVANWERAVHNESLTPIDPLD